MGCKMIFSLKIFLYLQNALTECDPREGCEARGFFK